MPRPAERAERDALRKRIKQMCDGFNHERWEKCFALVDPKLRERSKVEFQTYVKSLREFKKVYGSINPWHIRISLHLDASSSKRDDRPFAYAYIVWRDEARGFHMFRERWVKDTGQWFTRVVGLMPSQRPRAGIQD